MSYKNDKYYRPPPGQYSKELAYAVGARDVRAVQMLIDLGADPASHVEVMNSGSLMRVSAYETLISRIRDGYLFHWNRTKTEEELLTMLLTGTRIPLPDELHRHSGIHREYLAMGEVWPFDAVYERAKALSQILLTHENVQNHLRYFAARSDDGYFNHTNTVTPDHRLAWPVPDNIKGWDIAAFADSRVDYFVKELRTLQAASPELYAEVMEDMSIWASREDAAKYAAAVGSGEKRDTPAVPIIKPAWLQKILEPEQEKTILAEYLKGDLAKPANGR